MKLFNRDKEIVAACDGEAKEISQMKDEAFSSGLLGKGYMIEPNSNYFYSPIDGVIEDISEAKHAYSILSNDGLDILIHIGIDTVSLKGEGFEPQVAKGERVKMGDLITVADLDMIKLNNLCTQTAVVITNSDIVKKISYDYGIVQGGKSPIIKYKL